MKLTHTCIVTGDVKRLSDFYKQILQQEPVIANADYAEYATEGGALSISSVKMQDGVIKDSCTPQANRTIVLEFDAGSVAEVEKQYARFIELGIQLETAMVVQPWGSHAFYFRDPDGNLMKFYHLPK